MAGSNLYAIDPRPDERRFDIMLRGFWMPAAVKMFTRDLDAALAQVSTIRPMRSLIDARDLSILSVAIAPAFREFATNQARDCERVALVYGSTLALLQSKRLAGDQPQFRFFSDRGVAEAWLAEGWAAASAA